MRDPCDADVPQPSDAIPRPPFPGLGGYFMTTKVTLPAAPSDARTLDPVELLRTMTTARVMNDTLKARKTQGKFPFYIGCAGHESVAAVVAAMHDDDWLSFYYRDLAGWLQRTKDVKGPLRT